MNYKYKVKELEQLMASDSSRFHVELAKDWPGMEDDIRAAQVIIYRHLGKSGPLSLIEDCEMPDELMEDSHIRIKLPEWIGEVSETFRKTYSDEHERKFRFQKTLNKLVFELLDTTKKDIYH